jgi:hypothetical protein
LPKTDTGNLDGQGMTTVHVAISLALTLASDLRIV